MMHIVVFFICAAIVVLFLGYMQSSGELDRYSVAAVSIIVLLAVVSALVLGGTGYFPLAAVYVALLLLLHHTVIHRATNFGEERCACAMFQCKDVKNHETWVVASATAAVVSFFSI